MYVAVIPNRGSPPAILLRESYREAGKTKNRTLANLSGWPAERIEQLRAVLRGDKLLPAAEAVEIIRALPHGHVLAALGTARRIALDAVLPRRAPQRRRDLEDGALLLYDVTSTYLEGRCCELAQHGYSRDHRRDRPQIIIGLMCTADGCPIAVEGFEGNTAD